MDMRHLRQIGVVSGGAAPLLPTAGLSGDQRIQEQWRHYAGLSGEWHGVWHRYGVAQDGALTPGKSFPAVCHMALEANGQSVRHKNRYTPGDEPPGPPGKVVNGLHEVDFGVFDQAKFRQPFGPHSSALYMDGTAVVGSASFKASKEMVAMEFVLADPPDGECRHRRRLVATWRVNPRMADESWEGATASLASVTTIVEVSSAEGLAEYQADAGLPDGSVLQTPLCGGAPADVSVSPKRGRLTQWQGERRTTRMDGENIPGSGLRADGDAGALLLSRAYVLPGGLMAWLPMSLPLHLQASFEPWMSWRRTDDELVRVVAVYSDGNFTAIARDVFRP